MNARAAQDPGKKNKLHTRVRASLDNISGVKITCDHFKLQANARQVGKVHHWHCT